MQSKVRIWDLPTRLFHWALVICLIGLFITGKSGGSAMDWHFRFGFAMASLLLFRVLWGWFGGHWSRFATFLYPPRAILDYLRGHGSAKAGVGHNPLGAFSVFAMLGFLILQVGTGLFSDDQEMAFGPLSQYVSTATVRGLTAYHKNIGQAVLLLLVVMHLGAIVFYQLYRKNNLVGPMIRGDKTLAGDVPASRDDARTRTLAALLFLGCVAAVATVVKFTE